MKSAERPESIRDGGAEDSGAAAKSERSRTRPDPAAVLPVLLTTVLDSLDVALTCYDVDDRLVWWNVAAATFFPKVQHTLRAGTLAADRRRAKDEAGYGPSRR